jgi:predicted deacylase
MKHKLTEPISSMPNVNNPFQRIDIPVSRIGVTDIAVPVIRIGEGSPRCVVIAGLHGDETGSLVVIDELRRSLPPTLTGTLDLVCGANALALLSRTRESFVDATDMNRAFDSDLDITPTHRAARVLLEFVDGANAVIDLHSFALETPPLGICVAPTVDAFERNMALMRAFSPLQAWHIVPIGDDARYRGALGVALTARRIPFIAIELDDPQTVHDEDITACVHGIVRVLAHLGMCSPKEERVAPFPLFTRKPVRAQHTGVFTPQMTLGASVHEGDLLGTVRLVPEGTEHNVVAPCTGVVMQRLRRQFVQVTEELAAIGVEVEQ